jgi:hypothetical protein
VKAAAAARHANCPNPGPDGSGDVGTYRTITINCLRDGGGRSDEEAAQALGVEYAVIKLKDPSQWARSGVTMTPALVVDGQVKLQGRVLSVEKLKELIA